MRAARDSLSIYEVLVSAYAPRHEVFDVVCTSANQEEAERRLGVLLDIPEGLSGAQPIMDMAMSRWTEDSRDFMAGQAELLRRLVSDSQ